MNGDIAEEPLAKAVLRHLATSRGEKDPLGSFARTVLRGEASLRAAAEFPEHRDGLTQAVRAAQDEQARMTAEERAAYEKSADRVRDDLSRLP